VTKQKRMTAKEFMDSLLADPKWAAEHARKQEEFEKEDAELASAEAPLVADLRTAGYAVESVWDFVNTGAPYSKAIPILLDHFQRPYPSRIREGIARSLAVREARSSWDTLKRWYLRETDEGAKDGLACALCAIAEYSGNEHLDEVIELVRDRRHGENRLLLLSALSKSREPRARATLMDLGTDPDLRLEIQHILKTHHRKRSKRRTVGTRS